MSNKKETKIYTAIRIPKSLMDSIDYTVKKYPKINKNKIIEIALYAYFQKNEDAQRVDISNYLMGVSNE